MPIINCYFYLHYKQLTIFYLNNQNYTTYEMPVSFSGCLQILKPKAVENNEYVLCNTLNGQVGITYLRAYVSR